MTLNPSMVRAQIHTWIGMLDDELVELRARQDDLIAEVVARRMQRESLQTALAKFADTTPAPVVVSAPPVPMVRPPAPSVPAEPVILPAPPARPVRTPKVAATVPGPGPSTKYPRDEVARVAHEAIAAGGSVRKAVQAYFGVSVDMAGFLVSSARKAGHDIPTQPRTGRPSKVAEIAPPDDTAATVSSPPGVDEPQEPAAVPPVAAAAPAPTLTVVPSHAQADYDAVAATANEALAGGNPVLEAIATRFAVPIDTAKKWHERCRDRGLIAQPAAAELADPPEGTWDDVAEVYRVAIERDLRPVEHLTRVYGVERHIAKQWPAELRRRGLLPPRDTPPATSEVPMQFVSHRRAR